jgi:hypothetical protein
MAKKVVFLDSRRSQAIEFTTEATTLGDLKRDLRTQGVSDFDGMTFFEGISRIELKADDSVLPGERVYKGEVTSDLKILMTKSQKKIESGSKRKDLYAKIAELELAGTIRDNEGKNFTLCSNDVLEGYVNKALSMESIVDKATKPAKATKKVTKEVTEEVVKEVVEDNPTVNEDIILSKVANVLHQLVDLIDEDFALDYDIKNSMGRAINSLTNGKAVTTSSNKEECDNEIKASDVLKDFDWI